MKLLDSVMPFVLFGPILMSFSADRTNIVGLVSAAVGALTLALGCALMYRAIQKQGKELEQLRALLAERPPGPETA